MKSKFTAPKTSHVKSASYDSVTHHVDVKFKSGGEYDYAGVSPQRWHAFQEADSKGHYLHAKIVPNYTAKKLR